MLSTRNSPQNKGHIRTESEGLEKIFQANRDQKKPGVTVLISEKIYFKSCEKRQRSTFHNDQRINPRRYNNYKYICTQQSLLMKVKEESEKVGLKLNVQETKIMASGPITSYEDEETVSDFIFLCSKITADGDCSHQIKRCLLFGRKFTTNLDSLFKNREITLPTKIYLVKATIFPLVMYGCDSWIVKKAEHRRIDAFELWCWRWLLKVPWTATRSN